MPSFVTDADLLRRDPRVFIDLPVAARAVLRLDDGALAGVTLASTTGGFAALAAGHVLVIRTTEADAVAAAMAEVVDDHTVVVDRLLTNLAAVSGLTVIARTFADHIDAAHRDLLEAVGLKPAGDTSGDLTEAAIVPTGQLAAVEAAGALAAAHRAAAGAAGDDTSLAERARQWQRRYRAALEATRVPIDTDGDGRPDVWRTPGASRLVRV